jgi:hypothetical protein
MSNDPSAQQNKSRWTVISIALFVIGLLILVPSGLCTALVGIPFAFGGFAAGDSRMMFNILMLGIVPMALGAALVYAGLKSRRRD